MTINGTNYLLLQKHGCNYRADAPEREYSDVGNYRVFVEFTDRDGVQVCGDFGGWDIKDYTKKSRPIKKRNALRTDLQFEDERGCWVYRPAANAADYSYTLADILSFVNAISAEQYDAIMFIDRLVFPRIPASENFTPAGKILEYARRYNLGTHYDYGRLVLELYTGNYVYSHYSIKPRPDPDYITLTITLQEVSR